MTSSRSTCRWLAMACVLAGLAGCATSSPSPRPHPTGSGSGSQTLRIAHQDGGTHYRTIVHEGVWYQTFASSLLVIDPVTARVRATIDLGAPGTTGPAVDLAIARGRLYVLIEHDAVAEFDLQRARQPRLLGTIRADKLGVRPDRLSVVDDDLYVSGHGGVVRWSDGERFLEGEHRVSRVVRSTRGLVACIGRQAVRLEDGDYVGSASDLLELPASVGLPDRVLFIRRNNDRTAVGLMSRDIREVSLEDATHEVPGSVHNVRVLGRRVWIVTSEGIHVYGLSDRALQLRRFVDVLGARDVDRLTDNQVAVAGTFGRAIYRILRDGNRPGDTFDHAVRRPAGLVWAAERGGQVLAGGEEGSWVYTRGQAAEVSDLRVEQVRPLLTSAVAVSTINGSAAIIEGGRAVRLTEAGREAVFSLPPGDLASCLVGVRGTIWVGSAHGVRMVGIDDEGRATVIDEVRLAGPVRYLVPFADGPGAIYVSELGGFGALDLAGR